MKVLKSYTDIEQSKELAKILPVESADMCYSDGELRIGYAPLAKERDDYLPCWSLAALLNILPSSTLDSSNDHYYRLHCLGKFTKWHDNQIDTCYEMIRILKENNLI